jgi:hypothetical protein
MAEQYEDVSEKTETTYSVDIEELKECSKVESEVEKIKKARSSYERQWYINIAYLLGHHYCEKDKKESASPSLEDKIVYELKKIDRRRKTQRVSNYILPLFRSLLSKMIMQKTTITCDATTSAERDREATKVTQEVLEDFWQNANKSNSRLTRNGAGMMHVIKQLFTKTLGISCGYLYPYFNPEARGDALLEGKILKNVKIGAVEVEILSPFDVYEDPVGRFVIVKRIKDVDDLMTQYGVEIKPEKLEPPEHEQKIISMLEGSQPESYENSAIVYMKFSNPCNKYPDGRLWIGTKNKKIYDGAIPEEYNSKIPLFRFNYLMFGFAPYGQSCIEQVVNLQDEYNYTVTRLAQYKKWMAGKVFVPRKSKIGVKWDDEVGQLIMYDAGFGKPEYVNPPSPPAFLMEDLIRIRKDMEDIMSTHDSSMGRVPTGVKSGIGIENLTELDNSQIMPDLLTAEQQLSFFAEAVVEIMEKKYDIPRLLAIAGDTFGKEVATFKGEQLAGNKRIKISLGSNLPVQKEARQMTILEWMKLGIITQDKARELLEFGDIDGVFHNLDEQAEKEEIQLTLTKPQLQIVVEPYEEHNIRVKVLTDYMKSKEYMLLPEELKFKFKRHLEAHQKYIQIEAEAAARIQVNKG